MADRDPEFDAVVLPLLGAAYDVALRLTGARAEAEELTQETFVRALAGFDRFRRGTSARAWLLTILRNVHRNRIRSTIRHPEQHLDDELVAAPSLDRSCAPWETLTADDLDAAIALLPLHLREVVILRDLQGLTYKELAGTMDCPLGTVMSRLHRARAELRGVLVWRLSSRSRKAAR